MQDHGEGNMDNDPFYGSQPLKKVAATGRKLSYVKKNYSKKSLRENLK